MTARSAMAASRRRGELVQRRRLEDSAAGAGPRRGRAHPRDAAWVASSEWPPQLRRSRPPPTPAGPQHLRPEPRQELLGGRAGARRGGPVACRAAGAGRAGRSTLPCAVSGSGRHHEPRGQCAAASPGGPQAPAARCGPTGAQPARLVGPADVQPAPARPGHHVGDQPAARRRAPRAGDDRRLAHRGMAASAASISPELDAEAAHLDLVVDPAEELERRRPAGGGPGRRCGTSAPRPRPNGSGRTARPSGPAGRGSRGRRRAPPMQSSPGTPTGTGSPARVEQPDRACRRAAGRCGDAAAARGRHAVRRWQTIVALGRAVERSRRRPRKAARRSASSSGGTRLAADEQRRAARGAPAPPARASVDDLAHQRGHGVDGESSPPSSATQPLEVQAPARGRQQDQRAAGEQRAEQLEQRRCRTTSEASSGTRSPGAEAEGARCAAARVLARPRVLDQHPLGPAGRCPRCRSRRRGSPAPPGAGRRRPRGPRRRPRRRASTTAPASGGSRAQPRPSG